MSAQDALVFVATMTAGLSALFILAAFISDYAWPWIEDRWHERNTRPQATYKIKQA
jgi:hypothetical protein